MTWLTTISQSGLHLQIVGHQFQFDFYGDRIDPAHHAIHAWLGHVPTDKNLWDESIYPPRGFRPLSWLEQIACEWPAWLETRPDLEVLMMEILL